MIGTKIQQNQFSQVHPGFSVLVPEIALDVISCDVTAVLVKRMLISS